MQRKSTDKQTTDAEQLYKSLNDGSYKPTLLQRLHNYNFLKRAGLMPKVLVPVFSLILVFIIIAAIVLLQSLKDMAVKDAIYLPTFTRVAIMQDRPNRSHKKQPMMPQKAEKVLMKRLLR